ncbi:TIGR03643 family protein [Psychrobacter sp. FME5]|nr:TIGR03643 family protein [Psychrobacter sp. FME6]MBE0444368.1 TIGR03643 family protein [Psychrobacter sp. FME5]
MAQQGNSKSEATHEKSTQATTDRSLDAAQLSRVIEMAWEDRTPFDAIEHSYGFNESGVIKLMRQQLKPSSFRLWRQRVTSRATKHQAKRSFDVGRAYCKTQYKPR